MGKTSPSDAEKACINMGKLSDFKEMLLHLRFLRQAFKQQQQTKTIPTVVHAETHRIFHAVA
jgi:hypothetical protein